MSVHGDRTALDLDYDSFHSNSLPFW